MADPWALSSDPAARADHMVRMKRECAWPSRYYGGTGTIHDAGQLDVETDAHGTVVAVWFRCQQLPFRQSRCDDQRAMDMRGLYERGAGCSLTGVEVLDDDSSRV